MQCTASWHRFVFAAERPTHLEHAPCFYLACELVVAQQRLQLVSTQQPAAHKEGQTVSSKRLRSRHTRRCILPKYGVCGMMPAQEAAQHAYLTVTSKICGICIWASGHAQKRFVPTTRQPLLTACTPSAVVERMCRRLAVLFLVSRKIGCCIAPTHHMRLCTHLRASSLLQVSR